jgi:probable addiction module antidote protein
MKKGLTMNTKAVSYEVHLHEDLKDPCFAAVYLNECLKDDKEVFLQALHDVAKAYGVTAVAKKSGLNRESLYKMFKGNPRLDTLEVFLKTIGLTLSVEPLSEN